MEFEDIYKTLTAISPLTAEAWEDFKPLLESVSLKRNDYLIREGSPVHACYLLTEGVVRVYHNTEGNEYNKTFFIPGMFPTPLTALLTETPSELNFQALLPSSLIKFSYTGFKNLFEKHRCLERLMLRIHEYIWIKKERHDIRMVTNDAATNYALFKEEYPTLENLIPQYHIASYLGITPIQLSRIRTQIAKSRS